MVAGIPGILLSVTSGLTRSRGGDTTGKAFMRYFWSLLDRNAGESSAPYQLSNGLDAGKTPKSPEDGLFYRHGSDHGVEDLESLGATQLGFAGAFRVRHHPQHVPARTADSSDIFERSVGIS